MAPRPIQHLRLAGTFYVYGLNMSRRLRMKRAFYTLNTTHPELARV